MRENLKIYQKVTICFTCPHMLMYIFVATTFLATFYKEVLSSMTRSLLFALYLHCKAHASVGRMSTFLTTCVPPPHGCPCVYNQYSLQMSLVHIH